MGPSELESARAANVEQRSLGTAADERSQAASPNGSESSLPPTDGGKGAWLALAGCCVVQAPVWGFPLVSGVFQQYYQAHSHLIKGNVSDVALIGTTNTGILYLSSPILFAFLSRWPRLRRWCGPIGLLIVLVGLLASSFLSSITGLIVTQGVLQAIGSGLLFAPTTLYLDEWFVRRRGLAYGVMWSGKSAVGFVFPLAVEPALERFGFRTVLRAWVVLAAVITGPLLYFLQPRIPLSRASSARRLDTSFIYLSAFWMHIAGNILQSSGYFLPTAYLPSYAADIGLSPEKGTLLVSILNGVSTFGNPVVGVMNDRLHVTNVILISTIGSTISVFLFWGLSSQLALLVVFAVVYGLFAGGYSSTWSGVLTELKAQSPSLDTGLMFGLLAGARGVGNMISGPLSVALINNAGKGTAGAWGYGTEYGPVIIFTGATAVLGGWGWIWRQMRACC